MRLLLPVLVALAALPARAAAPSVTDPKAADADFAVQGEYAGTLTLKGRPERYGLQLVAIGGGRFKAALLAGGLPGQSKERPVREEATGEAGEQGTMVKGERWTATVKKGTAAFIGPDGKRAGQLRRVERRSPTLGARPPKGAVVLFDGKGLDRWEKGARTTEDGLLAEGATTVDEFGSALLHVEFRTPYAPGASGQARGNSGVYLQGRYEVQVLDSFGTDGKIDEAGAIYGVKPPLVNMAFPPLAWQTYDIEFTAAKYEGDRKVAPAKVTVRHNGVVVQQDTALPAPTRAAPVPDGPAPGPLHLQHHGDPVRYRNVWIVPR